MDEFEDQQIGLDDSLPLFYSVKHGLESSSPFRLAPQAFSFQLSNIPREKLPILHKALLRTPYISWKIGTETDLEFLIGVLLEHKGLDLLLIQTTEDTALSILNFPRFIQIIQSLPIYEIFIERSSKQLINKPLLCGLQHAKNLKKLTLQLNPRPEEMEAIAASIQNESLEELHVKDLIDADSWKTFTSALLSRRSPLKIMTVNGLYEDAEGYQALADLLKQNKITECLHLNCEMDSPQMTVLCDAMSDQSALKKLELFPQTRDDSHQILFKSLAHSRCTLSALTYCPLSTISIDSLKVLNESLVTNHTLTYLDISSSNINDDTCQSLFQGLAQNTTLKHLGFTGLKIGIKGTQALCDWLERNTLESLHLNWGWIKDTEIDKNYELIARMLCTNKSLRELWINSLTDKSVNMVCEAMSRNRTLQSLKLTAMNYDCFKGLTGVKNMMRDNNTLRRLTVSISWDSESVDLICEGIKYNNSIIYLDLDRRNQLDPRSVIAQNNLAAAMQHNYALEKMKVQVMEYDFGYMTHVQVATISKELILLLHRNRQLKASLRYTVAALSHNIARSKELSLFPREIWILILSSVTSPGLHDLDLLVQTIFALLV